MRLQSDALPSELNPLVDILWIVIMTRIDGPAEPEGPHGVFVAQAPQRGTMNQDHPPRPVDGQKNNKKKGTCGLCGLNTRPSDVVDEVCFTSEVRCFSLTLSQLS